MFTSNSRPGIFELLGTASLKVNKMQTATQKKTNSKRKNKGSLTFRRTPLDCSQINNMLNTVQQTLQQGYNEEGWVLISRIQKNLAGFLFQKERESLSRLVADTYTGLSKEAIVAKITEIRTGALA